MKRIQTLCSAQLTREENGLGSSEPSLHAASPAPDEMNVVDENDSSREKM
jgi:hypothetical protein